MTSTGTTTLRLLFPQWQGGNNPPYVFGAQLLSWLAPEATGPVEQVSVSQPDGKPLEAEGGIVGRGALLAQLSDARRLIDKHQPDRLVVLGGDCLVDLAPFAYLNERYDGDLAILWVDTHPDVMTPKEYGNAHAMVMGNLLGEGDADFVKAVKRPIRPQNVMFAGRQDTLESLAEIREMEAAFFERLKLRSASPSDLANTSEPVLDWLRSINAKHLAIHFDLDILDPTLFRSLLFANPDPSSSVHDGIPRGRMTMDEIVRLFADVSRVVDVVGLGITEHLPWDSLALKTMLSKLPLLGSPPR
ncbi:arginase family protein [Phreatobacter stygius]|uniref:Arginase family protein n=1 Tax=Phreatobacter stygius TaxID=1940610 RepID=A0A4D7BJJ3_9HYPH|nr:arginase family protein [Phreatobacter stygius]QCI67952.1 arginase family protein [Phreatobacter stygius]